MPLFNLNNSESGHTPKFWYVLGCALFVELRYSQQIIQLLSRARLLSQRQEESDAGNSGETPIWLIAFSLWLASIYHYQTQKMLSSNYWLSL